MWLWTSEHCLCRQQEENFGSHRVGGFGNCEPHDVNAGNYCPLKKVVHSPNPELPLQPHLCSLTELPPIFIIEDKFTTGDIHRIYFPSLR